MHSREIHYKPYVDDPNLSAVQNQKRKLRIHHLAQRDSISGTDFLSGICSIRDAIRSWQIFKEAKCISTYISTRSEVDNHSGILRALDAGKVICVPKVFGKEIRLFRIRNLIEDLEPGTFGVLEPKDFCEEIPIEKPELHIVPGVVFDCHGNRIGYGKGYYDRFLQRLPAETISLGLAFDCQIVESVPVEVNDVPLKYIATPSRGVFATS